MDPRWTLAAAACCAACATENGLPLGGDVTLTIDGETIVPEFGAVIDGRLTGDDPTKAMIVLGTRDINCETDLTSVLRKGTYLTMLIDPVAGAQTTATVSMIRVGSSGTLINGAPDEVTIDAFDARVTGSVMFETTDDIDGAITTLTAAGVFDVANCL